jgi:hypothetical protein
MQWPGDPLLSRAPAITLSCDPLPVRDKHTTLTEHNEHNRLYDPQDFTVRRTPMSQV